MRRRTRLGWKTAVDLTGSWRTMPWVWTCSQSDTASSSIHRATPSRVTSSARWQMASTSCTRDTVAVVDLVGLALLGEAVSVLSALRARNSLRGGVIGEREAPSDDESLMEKTLEMARARDREAGGGGWALPDGASREAGALGADSILRLINTDNEVEGGPSRGPVAREKRSPGWVGRPASTARMGDRGMVGVEPKDEDGPGRRRMARGEDEQGWPTRKNDGRAKGCFVRIRFGGGSGPTSGQQRDDGVAATTSQHGRNDGRRRLGLGSSQARLGLIALRLGGSATPDELVALRLSSTVSGWRGSLRSRGGGRKAKRLAGAGGS